MRTDPLAFEIGAGSEHVEGSRPVARQRLDETHAQRVAELFRDEYARLVHCMVAKTGSWPEARDVAAQAFAQVLEMRDPQGVSFLKAYVYQAARNLATDRAKLGAIRGRINQLIRNESVSTSPPLEPVLIQQQRLEILERAVEALRPTRKMMLKWRLWEDLTYSEIAGRFAAQGILVNERTLNRWYADALRELREAITKKEQLRKEGQL